MYVPGTLENTESVLVNIGTGYFVEKVMIIFRNEILLVSFFAWSFNWMFASLLFGIAHIAGIKRVRELGAQGVGGGDTPDFKWQGFGFWSLAPFNHPCDLKSEVPPPPGDRGKGKRKALLPLPLFCTWQSVLEKYEFTSHVVNYR